MASTEETVRATPGDSNTAEQIYQPQHIKKIKDEVNMWSNQVTGLEKLYKETQDELKEKERELINIGEKLAWTREMLQNEQELLTAAEQKVHNVDCLSKDVASGHEVHDPQDVKEVEQQRVPPLQPMMAMPPPIDRAEFPYSDVSTDEEAYEKKPFTRTRAPVIYISDNDDTGKLPEVPFITTAGLDCKESVDAQSVRRVPQSKAVWQDWSTSMTHSVLKYKADHFIDAAKNDGNVNLSDEAYFKGLNLLSYCRTLKIIYFQGAPRQWLRSGATPTVCDDSKLSHQPQTQPQGSKHDCDDSKPMLTAQEYIDGMNTGRPGMPTPPFPVPNSLYPRFAEPKDVKSLKPWLQVGYADLWKKLREGKIQTLAEEDTFAVKNGKKVQYYIKGNYSNGAQWMKPGRHYYIKGIEYNQNPHVIGYLAYYNSDFGGVIVKFEDYFPDHLRWLYHRYKKDTQWARHWTPLATEQRIDDHWDGRAQTANSFCVQIHLNDLHKDYRRRQWCPEHEQKMIRAEEGARVHGMLMFEHHPRTGGAFKIILDQWQPLNHRMDIVSACHGLGSCQVYDQ